MTTVIKMHGMRMLRHTVDDTGEVAKRLHLPDGESCVYASRMSPYPLVRYFLASVLFTVAFAIFVHFAMQPSDLYLYRYLWLSKALHICFIVLIIILFAGLFYKVFVFQNKYMAVTEHRIIISGIFNMNSETIMLNSIRNMDKHRGIFGLIMNFGRIMVQDNSGSWIVFRYVPNPDQFEAAIVQRHGSNHSSSERK